MERHLNSALGLGSTLSNTYVNKRFLLSQISLNAAAAAAAAER
jgi:hypothetical protein